MDRDPLVSIIIPVYNHGEYLAEAVQSAIRQSWQNTEVIIIDDCSTDNSFVVASQFLADQRVSLFRNEKNMDCVYTFNRGISISSGEYLGILAADDCWEREFVEKCVEGLKQHPGAAFAYTRLNLIDSNNRKHPRRSDRIKHKSSICSNEFYNIVKWLNPVPHHATLVRRECIHEVGMYDESLPTTHDWDLWIRLSSRYDAVFIDEYLSNYRAHQGNISKQRSRTGEKEKYIIELLDRVFSGESLPKELKEEKESIYARAWLDIAEGYRVIDEEEKARSCVRRALSYSWNPLLYLPYRRLLLTVICSFRR